MKRISLSFWRACWVPSPWWTSQSRMATFLTLWSWYLKLYVARGIWLQWPHCYRHRIHWLYVCLQSGVQGVWPRRNHFPILQPLFCRYHQGHLRWLVGHRTQFWRWSKCPEQLYHYDERFWAIGSQCASNISLDELIGCSRQSRSYWCCWDIPLLDEISRNALTTT